MNKQREYEVLWSCLNNGETPHRKSFESHNPRIKHNVCQAPDVPKKYGWMNCDRFLRDWFKKNKYTNTLILEYDVFVNKPLDSEPFADKVLIKNVLYPLNPNHERMANDLPDFLKPHKIFCSLLACTYLPKEAIDALINPIYDEFYKQTFQCEMRMFTVLSHAGFRPEKWRLPDLHGRFPHPEIEPHPGIHHPVKTKIGHE